MLTNWTQMWNGLRGAHGEEAEGQKHRTPSHGRGSRSAPTRTRTWNPLIKRVERSCHCELGQTAFAVAVESSADNEGESGCAVHSSLRDIPVHIVRLFQLLHNH